MNPKKGYIALGETLRPMVEEQAEAIEKSYLEAVREGEAHNHELHSPELQSLRDQVIDTRKDDIDYATEQISDLNEKLQDPTLLDSERKALKAEKKEWKRLRKADRVVQRESGKDYRGIVSQEAADKALSQLDTYDYWGGDNLVPDESSLKEAKPRTNEDVVPNLVNTDSKLPEPEVTALPEDFRENFTNIRDKIALELTKASPDQVKLLDLRRESRGFIRIASDYKNVDFIDGIKYFEDLVDMRIASIEKERAKRAADRQLQRDINERLATLADGPTAEASPSLQELLGRRVGLSVEPVEEIEPVEEEPEVTLLPYSPQPEREDTKETNNFEIEVGSIYEPVHDQDRMIVDEERGLFAIFDGVGGHAGGSVAADIAKRRLEEYFEALPDSLYSGDNIDDIQRALARAHHEIIDTSDAGLTTAVVAKLFKDSWGSPRVAWAAIGDSRLYKLNTGNNTITQISQDEGYQKFVTNILGAQGNEVVQTGTFDFLPGDHLILCSDGITGDTQEQLLSDEEVRNAVIHADTPEMAAKELARISRKEDDTTAIVVRNTATL